MNLFPKHNHRDVDRALAALRETPAFSAEWERALDTRVRSDVITRYGSFAVPVRAPMPVHTTDASPRGMLFLPLRFAGALAVAVFMVMGVRMVMQTSDDRTGLMPTISTSAPVTREITELLVTPGSGNALSVFTTIAAPATPNRIQNVRPIAPPRPQQITPAPGVFTTWGSSVFTEDERVKNSWNGKNVFSS